MAEEKKPAAPAAPAKPGETSAAAAPPKITVESLRDDVATLKREIRSLEGLLQNRDPKVIAAFKAENDLLRTRVAKLQKALVLILVDAQRPRSAEDANSTYTCIQQSSLKYLQKLEMDPEIWKRIES